MRRLINFAVVLAALSLVPSIAARTSLPEAALSLFEYSMQVQDSRYDSHYNYIWYQDKGPWSVRFTAWYVAGLLYRNEGSDLQHAKAALENIMACQMIEDFDSAWYGTFKLSPDQPTPDSVLYHPKIYTTYDPNWREFIGTQLVQIIEEFESLLDDELVQMVETSLEHAAIGAMRRNGSYPEDDNLTIGYSNPQLMRALVVGWIGNRKNNDTFIDFANQHGDLTLQLFQANGSNTLGEYNAPTYYGMDTWALAANIKYGPKNATMTKNAEFIMVELWKDIAAHYNQFLGNLAGPYDRAYTRDMTEHSAILSMFWWGMYGREYGLQPPKGESDLLFDIAQGAALSLVMETAKNVIPADVHEALTSPFTSEPRFLNKTIREDLSTDYTRIATSWISKELMIGAEQVDETKNRGDQFVPAIVHWASDKDHKPYPYSGFLSLYPSASTIKAVAGPNKLTISYPNSTQQGADIFTFALSGIPPSWMLGGNRITGFDQLPCLYVEVDAPGLEKLPVTYGEQLRDH
ncbi:hypothetical protein K469DRAFT_724231 [Zopfia rhizophila CBS 207.26]|uniref:Linalool dehydratase/isomerase domain-containing protein n=1 Tax=Zopfia rhizophila CBS 207.26 TaxID=1314779 RepID=A0A6A6EAM2_9PEZI|nr:hypothetical protein K469DRAFT_724231 [Zopfia rhizophila CBS 207.26]